MWQKLSMYTLKLALVSLLILFSTSLVFAEDFRIGVLPEMNVFKQMERFRPLAEHLSRKIGTPVKLTMISRYGNIIETLKEKKVDAAFLGSFTGALAISQLGVEPLARPVNMDETSTYFGHIFVRKDSGISNVREMKGKTMVFVERATTAGYVFPLAYLKRSGIVQHDTYFAKSYFSGSHDGAIQAVLDGHADVGAAKNTILERLIKEHPDIQGSLVIIASSPRVPSNGLCVVAGTDENLKRKIRETLLSLDKHPDGKRVLQKFGALRFVDTSKNDYQPVFDLAQEADIDLSAYTYVNQ